MPDDQESIHASTSESNNTTEQDASVDMTMDSVEDNAPQRRARRMAGAPAQQNTSPLPEELQALWADSVDNNSTENHSLGAHCADTHKTGRITLKPRQIDEGTASDYERTGTLGEGGMGVVLSARQTAMDRTIALKMIRADKADDDNQRAKFLAEATVTANLDHPGIVPVYDLGLTQEGSPFYAMKHVKGRPWEDVILKNDLVDNLDILLRVCDAMAFAHDHNVIHRDLKPDNVMIGDYGEVLLMDWGLAAGVGEESKATPLEKCTALAGTPTYMAPEMAMGRGDLLSVAADIYLLGGILYRIVTGRTPHTGANVMKCLEAAARNDIQPAGESGELVDIALRAMATRPEDRYASVKEFRTALRDYQQHRESILLSTHAANDLKKAQASGDYRDFNRALFGNEEALSLWDENTVAREALSTVRLAYAECAADKGDLDLAQSLLEEGNLTETELGKKVIKLIRKRAAAEKRMNTAKRVAAGAIKAQSSNAERLRKYRIATITLAIVAGVSLVGGIATSLYLYSQLP